MDAFKLLTRSTKLKTGANTRSAGATPSTGKAENPRLFRNSEGDKILEGVKSGKKRKRGMQVVQDSREDDEEEEDAAELDFFNAGGKKAAPVVASGGDAVVKESGTKDEADLEDGSSEEVMDEVERRTVLNAHKIKVTDLRDLEDIQPAAPKEEEPTTKKKKKAQKEESAPAAAAAPTKKQQKKARRLFPQPLVSFKELRSKYKIPRGLAENIAEQGFTDPTEVQLGTLPLLLGESTTGAQTSKTGKGPEPDLLVVAPTGSGKTLAFLIPVIDKICRLHHERDERGVFSVVVAPTRELAGQIVNEGRKLVAGTGVKITMMKKGMRVAEHEDDDEHGSDDLDKESDSDDDEDTVKDSEGKRKQVPITKSDIIVTTPLLLVNALSENRTRPMATLPLVRSLVLDEADVLLDPLFREQTLDIWRSCTHPELRVSLWSATMGSNIEELTKSNIKERHGSIQGTHSSPLLRLVVGLKDSAIPNLHHKLVYAATEQGKLLGLRQLLHPSASSSDVRLRPPFLIFTQTIPRAIALHSELRYDIPPEAGGSARIAVLHSDLSDNQRSEIMKDFRKGEIWILVTTDLLARGVDFRGINGVVNYDIPNSAAVYVHRVGRTGRAGREGGIAVTYYTKEDIPYVKHIANVIDVSEKLRGGPDGEKSVQKWLLDALPDLSKRSKQELKKHGVRARQSALKNVKDDTEHRRTRISTKSGFERRQENKKKALIEASQKRKVNQASGDDDNWRGVD